MSKYTLTSSNEIFKTNTNDLQSGYIIDLKFSGDSNFFFQKLIQIIKKKHLLILKSFGQTKN